MTVARRVVLAALLCTSAALGGGASDARHITPGISWNVTAAPFRLQLVSGGKVVTTLGGTSSPLSYVAADGTADQIKSLLSTRSGPAATTYVLSTSDPSRNATLSVSGRGDDVGLRLVVPHAQAVGVDFAAPAAAHFLGSGERLRWVDLRGTVVPLKVRNACGSNSPSPFFASTAGFGVWSSSTAVGRLGFPSRVDDTNFACDLGAPPCSVGPPVAAVRFCFKSSDVSFEVAAGSLSSILTRHAKSVGLPRAPWLPQFALMKWRDVVSGPGDLTDDIQQLRSRGIPIGWVILDNPWESGAFQSDCYGSLTFDSHVFPDPKAMIAGIHALGVRFMLWISPQLERTSCAPPPYPDGWLSGNNKVFVRDLTNPPEAADFEQRLLALVNLGVDGFKGDRGDEVNLEPDTLVGGSGVQLQDEYPLLYAKLAAAALSSVHGSAFATLFRSFVPGSSSVLPGVTGPDEPQTFDGLQNSIRAAQTAGVAGDPVWGTDIGGYTGGMITPDLFVRWAQFSALTPIFEVGGAGATATFWQLGQAAVDGFKAAATLHYELAPFLYELAEEASRNGLPVVRPLGLSWPDDQQAWAHDFEFTVGSALLAAPLTNPGDTSSVYLPAGTWTNFFTGQRFAGARVATVTSGPDDFPLFVRAGTALADNFRTPELWAQPWRPDDLVRDDRQGWLVAAQPDTTATASDRGSVLTATTAANGDVALQVTHARTEQQFRVLSARRICHVASGAVSIPFTSSDGGTIFKVERAPATLALRLTACSGR